MSPTPTPRLGGTVDPVVSVIKSKVLQEFIPQVPDIVTFIEKQYGFDSVTARNFLQTRVVNVLTALSSPLADEQQKLQRKVDTQDAELVLVKDLLTSGNAANKAIRNDLHECERKAVAAVKETASLKAQNNKHGDNLMALMRAFGLSTTNGGKLSTAWTKLNKSVDALLRQREEHETTKRQFQMLQEKLKEKSDQLNAAVDGEQKQSGERIARLSDQLVTKHKEFETYKTNAEYEIDTLKQSVDQRNAQIEELLAKEANGKARLEQLTENGVSKQSRIDQLTEAVAANQSVIEQLTAARDESVSMLDTARNEHTSIVSSYTAQIDTLNEEINALRTNLIDSMLLNDQSKTLLDEFSVIKSLYDRVSKSLKAAQAYYGTTVNYNEPVTNIILDVLAKVQANATDFSGVIIPKPTPIWLPDNEDTDTDTARTPTLHKRRSKRLHLKASKNDSEPVKRPGNKMVDFKRKRKQKRSPYNKQGRTKSSDKIANRLGKIDVCAFDAWLHRTADQSSLHLSQHDITSNSYAENVDAPSQSPLILEGPLTPSNPKLPQEVRDMLNTSDQESLCAYSVHGDMPTLDDNELFKDLI